ncbi:hypothetical protein [Burkholderia sp. Leaf177]|uniref:hypothetical protein n=1 Tax=Burkholderia sp. Leaf177 TaxID=1736287 RepID=UPI0012E35BC0|nr:hypothetical protein [Burkholderia sp. Leaf177]
MTQTTPDKSPGFMHASSPESSRATQVVSVNAARVIETTRHAWLGDASKAASKPAMQNAVQARRPRFSRRPIVANLALVMNFWSTRPL